MNRLGLGLLAMGLGTGLLWRLGHTVLPILVLGLPQGAGPHGPPAGMAVLEFLVGVLTVVTVATLLAMAQFVGDEIHNAIYAAQDAPGCEGKAKTGSAPTV